MKKLLLLICFLTVPVGAVEQLFYHPDPDTELEFENGNATAGGQYALTSGAGGAATGGSGAGGNGGDFTFYTGQGGASTSGTGGIGGGLTFSISAGGNGVTGGAGGFYNPYAGNGGTGTTGNGGAGGALNYTSGNGGASSGGGNGGAAGDVNFTAGASGTGGTRPNGGNIYLRTGAGTADGNIFLGVDVSATIRGQVSIGRTTNSALLHLAAGTATASTAPLKFTSGTSLTTAEAGAIEFTTDDFFATITTGAARKAFVLDDGTRLTSGRVPFATTNGRLVDDADMTFATDTLTVTKIVGAHDGTVGANTPSSGVFTSLQADTITNDTGLAAGTYTPTRSAEANMDSNVTMTEAQYMRVGNTVTVSGRFTADPTLTATATSFEITLPVASNIGAVEDVAGVAFCGSIAGMGAEVIGVVANDTAKIQWVASDITSQTWSYTFSFQVI